MSLKSNPMITAAALYFAKAKQKTLGTRKRDYKFLYLAPKTTVFGLFNALTALRILHTVPKTD